MNQNGQSDPVFAVRVQHFVKSKHTQIEASLKGFWDATPPHSRVIAHPTPLKSYSSFDFNPITPEPLTHQSMARFWEGTHFKQYFLMTVPYLRVFLSLFPILLPPLP